MYAGYCASGRVERLTSAVRCWLCVDIGHFASQVLLLPKPLLYLQSDASISGRPLPSHYAADKDEPVQALGPWSTAETLQELASPAFEARHYFFAYICAKPRCEQGADLPPPLQPLQPPSQPLPAQPQPLEYEQEEEAKQGHQQADNRQEHDDEERHRLNGATPAAVGALTFLPLPAVEAT
jgi:hypothetical protein